MTRWLVPLLLLCFLLSGMAGLIYQVLWLRLLSLVFGVTVYAASTVLASFMGGLALGSFLAGRLIDRIQRPLLIYGIIEIFVGLSALATPLALHFLERVYIAAYWSLPENLAVLTLVRFLASAVVLLVPTTLMGATLPIVMKSSALRESGLTQRAALLYATNTLGAVIGTVLAGFALIGGVGIQTSFLIASALNLLVGLLAILYGRAHVPASHAQVAVTEHAHAIRYSGTARRTVLAVFAVSGGVALALEIVWFRVLVLVLQSTTYAFTIMLATVLAGIALGSYLVAPLLRRSRNWLLPLGLLEVLIGLAALLSITALPLTRQSLTMLPQIAPGELDGPMAPMFVASALAIVPACLLMGAAFPIGLEIWNDRRTNRVGSDVGTFYALNLFGGIVGSTLAGFVLLPGLGSETSLQLLAALSGLSGVALLVQIPRARRNLALGLGSAAALVFATAAWRAPDPFDVAIGYNFPKQKVLWREEGIQGTVSVHKITGKAVRAMYVDGMHQADDTESVLKTHYLIGHLPLMLHPDPREALVIGLGGGATAGAISLHSNTSIDLVELSASVAHGSEWFRDVNYDVLRKPNVHLRVDDGRNFMLMSRKKYDVIAADIIQPVFSGAGSLYSREYFQLAADALNDDGLMVQWVSGRSDAQYRLIARAFQSAFPYTTAWHGGTLLIGAKQPLTIREADFERRVTDAVLRTSLERIGINNFKALRKHYVASPDELREFLGTGELLSDDRPQVEYFRSLPPDGRADLGKLQGDSMRIVAP